MSILGLSILCQYFNCCLAVCEIRLVFHDFLLQEYQVYTIYWFDSERNMLVTIKYVWFFCVYGSKTEEGVVAGVSRLENIPRIKTCKGFWFWNRSECRRRPSVNPLFQEKTSKIEACWWLERSLTTINIEWWVTRQENLEIGARMTVPDRKRNDVLKLVKRWCLTIDSYPQLLRIICK